MSKSATSDGSRSRAGAISWLLAQTFWVGGLWLLQFVVLPTLERIGLAPLLVQEIGQGLRPLLMGFTAFCAAIQGGVLLTCIGIPSLWHDRRGHLLVAVMLLALGHLLAVAAWGSSPGVGWWLSFSYLSAAICGLVLVIQDVPGKAARA